MQARRLRCWPGVTKLSDILGASTEDTGRGVADDAELCELEKEVVCLALRRQFRKLKDGAWRWRG